MLEAIAHAKQRRAAYPCHGAGHALPDESFEIRHDTYGILGMANTGRVHSAQSQFYVTFAPCPCFDHQYVAFGKLVDGTKLLRYLEEVRAHTGRQGTGHRATQLAAGCTRRG